MTGPIQEEQCGFKPGYGRGEQLFHQCGFAGVTGS